MATITVTNTNDSGPGSLRAAIGAAESNPGGDRIVFAAALDGQTITLTSGRLTIAAGDGAQIIIDGDRNHDGVADITVSGNSQSSILAVAAGATATIDGLTMTAGFEVGANYTGAAAAGAILNQGTLSILDCAIVGTYAVGGSGANSSFAIHPGGIAAALVNFGELHVSDSSFQGNAARGGKGGIGPSGGNIGGTGGYAAGGIVNAASGTATLDGVTLEGNTATGGDGGNGGFSDQGGGGVGGTGGSAADAILNLGAISGTVSHLGGLATGGRGGGGGFGNGGTAPPGDPGRAGGLMTVGTVFADSLAGFGGAESVYGWFGNDAIGGAGGADTLYGEFGNDTLTGGGGFDILVGAEGDDRLIGDTTDNLDGGAANDTIVLTKIGHGIFKGGDGIDTLDLSQAGATTGVYDLNAVSFTTAAGGRFSGFEGIIGTKGAETILGTPGSTVLDGGAGNDTISSGGGHDTLIGGSGNDHYIEPAPSLIVEAEGGGIDTIHTALGRNLASDANVENVTLDDVANAEAIGNELDNVLTGNIGNNELTGAAGNDTLVSGGGADQMSGGIGNDVYVDPGASTVVEAPGEGIDTVQSAASRTLAANVERLILTGSEGINGTGNDLGNVIVGNSRANRLNGLDGTDDLRGNEGNDTLTGGAGNDTLSGGLGNDLFRFAKSGAGVDRIADFDRTVDRFDLAGGSFSAVTAASNGAVFLTHAGGTVRVENAPSLSLGQWNALVIPAGGAATGAPVALESRPTHAAVLQTEIVHLSPGEWLFA